LKNKILLITAIVFFLIINTWRLWNLDNPVLLIPIMLLVFITWCILAGAMVWQGYKVTAEKFKNKERNITVILVAVVVGLAIYSPFGIIDFERFESKDLLIAEGQGRGNCMTFVKLKKDKTFRKGSECFGVAKEKGEYSIHNDTITFSDIDKGFYKFALIERPDSLSEGKTGDLLLYSELKDTTPVRLWIIKNELIPN